MFKNSMSKHLRLEVEDKDNIRIAINGKMYPPQNSGKLERTSE